MNIKTFLMNSEKRMLEKRLENLKNIEAPEVMISSLIKTLNNFEDTFKVGGEKELLDVEYEKHEVVKGKGGKIHLIINGYIVYFPEAKYGRFITEDNGFNA